MNQATLKKILGGGKTKKIILLFAASVFLILLFFPFDKSEEKTEKKDSRELYIENLEKKLEKILSETKGVGRCSVVITAVGGSEYVYAADTSLKNQTTENGDKKQFDSDSKVSLKTITEQRDEKPLIEKEIYPEIQGVFILCSGGGSSKIKAGVTEIAATLLGVTKEKIAVGEMR